MRTDEEQRQSGQDPTGFNCWGQSRAQRNIGSSAVTAQLDQLRPKPQDLREGSFNLGDLPAASHGIVRSAQTLSHWAQVTTG